MAIKVNGTTVIDDNRNLVNIEVGLGAAQPLVMLGLTLGDAPITPQIIMVETQHQG